MAMKDPAGMGKVGPSNSEQLASAVGLGNFGVQAATNAANAYMNRNKKALPEKEEEAIAEASSIPSEGVPAAQATAMTPIPTGTTPEQIESAPPSVIDSAAKTGMVPKAYVEGVQQQQEAQAKIAQGEEQARAVAAETATPAVMPQETEEQKIENETQSVIKSIEDQRAQIRNDLANTKIEPKNFFTGKSTWQKIVGGIGLALSSLSPQSAQNALKIINDEIDRDILAQKENINQKKGALNDADKALVQARGILKDERASDIQAKRLRLEAAKFHIQQQEAATNSAVMKQKLGLLLREADREDAKLAIKQRELVANGGGKAPTDTQFKAAGHAKAMEVADQQVAKLTKSGTTGSGFGDAMASILPEFLKPNDVKKLTTAQNAWVMNMLRPESGAAIGREEIENGRKTYFPQVGDSPEVRANKAELRRQKYLAVKSTAGRAYDRVSNLGMPQVEGFKAK